MNPPYLCLHGRAIAVGKSPDGDSLRFAPDDPALWAGLHGPARPRFAKDGSAQLRLEGLDAPELSYQDREQPFARASRNILLEEIGFSSVAFAADDSKRIVGGFPPGGAPCAILTRHADLNGRPIAFLFAESVGKVADDGAAVELTPEIAAQSVNLQLLALGAAYPLLYESVRAALRQAATTARTGGRGLWPLDSSRDFPLEGIPALGPRGALIMPKLFRRCVDFFRARGRGGATSLLAWLNEEASPGVRPRNDRFRLGNGPIVQISDLLSEEEGRASLRCSPDEMGFLDVT